VQRPQVAWASRVVKFVSAIEDDVHRNRTTVPGKDGSEKGDLR